MRVTEFPEDSLLVTISSAALSKQPINPSSDRFIKAIELTQTEFDQLRKELQEYGMIPVWVQFITIDGQSPFPTPAQMEDPQARILTMPGAR